MDIKGMLGSLYDSTQQMIREYSVPSPEESAASLLRYRNTVQPSSSFDRVRGHIEDNGFALPFSGDPIAQYGWDQGNVSSFNGLGLFGATPSGMSTMRDTFDGGGLGAEVMFNATREDQRDRPSILNISNDIDTLVDRAKRYRLKSNSERHLKRFPVDEEVSSDLMRHQTLPHESRHAGINRLRAMYPDSDTWKQYDEYMGSERAFDEREMSERLNRVLDMKYISDDKHRQMLANDRARENVEVGYYGYTDPDIYVGKHAPYDRMELIESLEDLARKSLSEIYPKAYVRGMFE